MGEVRERFEQLKLHWRRMVVIECDEPQFEFGVLFCKGFSCTQRRCTKGGRGIANGAGDLFGVQCARLFKKNKGFQTPDFRGIGIQRFECGLPRRLRLLCKSLRRLGDAEYEEEQWEK